MSELKNPRVDYRAVVQRGTEGAVNAVLEIERAVPRNDMREKVAEKSGVGEEKRGGHYPAAG